MLAVGAIVNMPAIATAMRHGQGRRRLAGLRVLSVSASLSVPGPLREISWLEGPPPKDARRPVSDASQIGLPRARPAGEAAGQEARRQDVQSHARNNLLGGHDRILDTIPNAAGHPASDGGATTQPIAKRRDKAPQMNIALSVTMIVFASPTRGKRGRAPSRRACSRANDRARAGADGGCPTRAAVAAALSPALAHIRPNARSFAVGLPDSWIWATPSRSPPADRSNATPTPARDCAERARVAAVFVALAMNPPSLEPPRPPPPVAPPVCPPPPPTAGARADLAVPRVWRPGRQRRGRGQ